MTSIYELGLPFVSAAKAPSLEQAFRAICMELVGHELSISEQARRILNTLGESETLTMAARRGERMFIEFNSGSPDRVSFPPIRTELLPPRGCLLFNITRNRISAGLVTLWQK